MKKVLKLLLSFLCCSITMLAIIGIHNNATHEPQADVLFYPEGDYGFCNIHSYKWSQEELTEMNSLPLREAIAYCKEKEGEKRFLEI